MAFEQDGDVKRRYQYGPTGEVLFDQVFDHTVTTTLQSETDLLVPLGDHQHSTRVVLAHTTSPTDALNDVAYIRQSLDYAEFGRVTATLGANGLADAGGSVTVFSHHGSIADAATGLQLKGERWYSPDLGRFISEDPIQDGANWYMFAGNDPVNYADPSGLSMQGYPLNGGFSGNKPVSSTIGSGSITANSLFGGAGTAVGNAIAHGLGTIAGALASSRPAPSKFDIFNRQLSSEANLSALTRTLPISERYGVSKFVQPELPFNQLLLVDSREVSELARIVLNPYGPRVAHVQQFGGGPHAVDQLDASRGSGSIEPGLGLLKNAFAAPQPTYRITYENGRSVTLMGGDPSTADGIGIPGVGAVAVKSTRPVVNAVREVAPTILGKAKGVLADAFGYIKNKVGLSNNTTDSRRMIEQPYQQQQAGIYEFPDATADDLPYVGNTDNWDRRFSEHEQTGKLAKGTTPKTTDVPGDRTAREIAEHRRIQELTEGVPARHSPKVSNKKDPIGPKRKHLLDD